MGTSLGVTGGSARREPQRRSARAPPRAPTGAIDHTIGHAAVDSINDRMEADVDGATPAFEHDIRPLFREQDITAMAGVFDLSAYADVRANADRILAAVAAGTMPCDGRWREEQVALFRSWTDAGCPQ